MMRILADAQALQSPINLERGIGRYVSEFVTAVDQNHPSIVDRWVIRPGLPIPAHNPRLLSRGRLILQDDPAVGRPDVWHVMSPFEWIPDRLETVFPTWARDPRTRLVTTLYDLIPLLYPERYLVEPSVRRSYSTRLQLVQRSDLVLAISESAAKDAVRLLKIPARRIEVVGTGVSERFVPAEDPGAALAQAQRAAPRLRSGYVMYTGGIDFRKNIDGLLLAYAKLPSELRRDHQLVIVCRVQDDERARLENAAVALGVGDNVLLTGFVPDEALLALYQAAHLFVFPSLYEGFGLPVVEALSCGVPVLIGANSSLTELVPDPRAHFDAAIPDDITRAMFAALTDSALREALCGGAANNDYRWNVVAERAVDAYTRLNRPTRPSRRLRVELVSPMPPAASGVADYSSELLRSLAIHADVDVFTDATAERVSIRHVNWHRYDELIPVGRMRGRPDMRLFAMGNSEFHIEVLRLFRRLGGVVMAHDVRFTDLAGVLLREAPEMVDDQTRELVQSMWRGERPPRHRDHESMPPRSYYSVNGLLTGAFVGGAERVLVHSTMAHTLASLDLPPAERGRVETIPFGHVLRHPYPFESRDAVVSLGIVDDLKESRTVCAAFVELAPRFPHIAFAIVGAPTNPQLHEDLTRMVRDAGAAERVHITGRATAQQYDHWLGRARLAVQLRARSNGETSAAIADCLGSGVPVIATDIGSMSDLAHVCRLVEPGIPAADLGTVIDETLNDPTLLAELSTRSLAHAHANTFDSAAASILASLLTVEGHPAPTPVLREAACMTTATTSTGGAPRR